MNQNWDSQSAETRTGASSGTHTPLGVPPGLRLSTARPVGRYRGSTRVCPLREPHLHAAGRLRVQRGSTQGTCVDKHTAGSAALVWWLNRGILSDSRDNAGSRSKALFAADIFPRLLSGFIGLTQFHPVGFAGNLRGIGAPIA